MGEVPGNRHLYPTDVGLVRTVGAWTTGKEWGGGAECIAARALDVNNLGAEFGKLGTDVGLRHQHAGADRLSR